jgi:Rad3-related DNA helicase
MNDLREFSIDRIKPLPQLRDKQQEVIEKTIKAFNSKKFVILEAPTGFGKSFAAIALGNYYSESTITDTNFGTYILVHQKVLQEQYMNEKWTNIKTPDGKIANLVSAENYNCSTLKHLGVSCREVGLLRKKENGICPTFMCQYAKDRENFNESPISITNIQFFLNYSAYSPKVNYKKLMICDEAHSLEQSVMNFVSTDISEFFVKTRLKIDFPNFKNDTEIMNWVSNLFRDKVSEKKNEIQSVLEQYLDKKRNEEEEMILSKNLREYDMWDKYICKLNRTINKWDPNLWVIDTNLNKSGQKNLSLKPILINDFTHELLFQRCENVFLMSGTILDKKSFCQSVGIFEENAEFIQVDSSFDLKNRPVYYMPAGSMSKNNIDQTLFVKKGPSPMVQAVSHILEAHKNDKGVVHCVDENSQILLSDGNEKSISEIKVGDKIKTFNEETKIFENKIVLNNIDQGEKECIELEFSNGKKLICTLDHKILTKNRGWIEANNLSLDDEIMNG